MRLLYDHQIFLLQRFGGISRYYVELIERLRGSGVDARLSTQHSENHHLLDSNLSANNAVPPRPWSYRPVRYLTKRTGRDIAGFMDQRCSVKALKRTDFDIFQPTYYLPYFLQHLDGRPFALTVYDMIHEIFLQKSKPSDPTPQRKKLLVERAERVIAISGSTKNDLVRIMGVSPSKVDVVHLASSLDPAQAAPRPETLPNRYVLYVGNRSTYKNFDRFSRAMSKVMREEGDLHMVCGGGRPFRPSELKMLNALGIGERTRYMDIDDPMLACLYANAEAFVFPSLYEGFGIPILEAMSCGCPLISSNTSSFPEVAGGAGVMFDPTDEAAMAEKILDVVRDKDLRRCMADKGRERARGFRWDITARETLKIYEGML